MLVVQMTQMIFLEPKLSKLLARLFNHSFIFIVSTNPDPDEI